MAIRPLQRWLKRSALLAAITFGLALWTGVAQAQDVAPADVGAVQAVITLTPSDDAYIDSANAAQNFGAAADLQVSSQASTQDALIRFDLSAFPQGTVINSATLRLAQIGAEGGAPQVQLPIWQVYSQWSEESVTYEIQPATDNIGLFMASPSAANVTVDADITSLVDAWVNSPCEQPELRSANPPANRQCGRSAHLQQQGRRARTGVDH